MFDLELKKIQKVWQLCSDRSTVLDIRKCDIVVLFLMVISCRGRIPALTKGDAVNGGWPEQAEQPGWAASGAPEQSPVRDLIPA